MLTHSTPCNDETDDPLHLAAACCHWLIDAKWVRSVTLCQLVYRLCQCGRLWDVTVDTDKRQKTLGQLSHLASLCCVECTLEQCLCFCYRVPTLYEELNSLTFPDHAHNFSITKLTCNSYFSLHFSRLLLPYADSLCYHYHILNHWEWKGTEAWRK